jgi:hypothetical protein
MARLLLGGDAQRMRTMNTTRAMMGMLLAASMAGSALSAPVSGQGTWETTLQARDINGDGKIDAYYDTVLKITWLADANAGAGSVYDSIGHSTATDGLMTWQNAFDWAASLNVYGTTGWRLPMTIDTGMPGCAFAFGGGDCGFNVQTISADGQTVYSELAHLYYVTLGNQAACNATGSSCLPTISITPPNYLLSNTGPFENLKPFHYWSSDSVAPTLADHAWDFNTMEGIQGPSGLGGEYYALAVRPGDVDVAAAVPEPQTYALMLLGLGVVTVVARRRRSI